MSKILLQAISEQAMLYRDSNGLAWVEDGSTGLGHSCHPNIHGSGSVSGMKKQGYWDKDDQTIRSHGFIYNISQVVAGDDLDLIALSHCRCGGQH